MSATLAPPPDWVEADAPADAELPLEEIDRRLHEDSGLEYADGEFIERTSSERTARVNAEFACALWDASRLADRARIARLYDATLIYRCWPDDPTRSRRPRCSVIVESRLADLRGDVNEMTIVPDLAVEVVSPKDRAVEVEAKLVDYRIAGFPLVWVVYPAGRVLHARTPAGVTILEESAVLELPGLLPDFRHTVADLLGPTPTASDKAAKKRNPA